MCRIKSEIAACQMCSAPIAQVLGKGRARLYCGKCLLKRHRVGRSEMTCRVCGKTWMREGPGRIAKYCSPRCARAFLYPKRAKEIDCIRCNSTFVSKTGKGRLCPQCHHWRPSHGERVDCLHCGHGFYRRPSCSQMYCSRKCLHAALRTWHRCKHCAKVFSRRKYRASDKREYCCMQCYWDAHGMDGSASRRLAGRHTGNTRKRCRKMGVPYDPSVTIARVAERDAHQCQICGRQCNPTWLVSKATRRPHPRNRTIDHIVPIAAGRHGHEWHNVQCACLACNVKKGSRWSFGQLRLL